MVLNTSLQRIDLETRGRVMEFLRRYPPAVCEQSFANLYNWRHSEPVHFLDLGDTIVFVAMLAGEHGGNHILGPPIGTDPGPARLRDLIPGLRGYIRVTEPVAARLADEGLQVAADPDNDDFVYLVADLATLSGERFHKKRNLVKQCLDSYACRYEPIGPANIPECLAMQAEWCGQRQCERDPGLCHEYDAIREAFARFEALALLGGVIRVEGTVRAYAVGEQLAPDTAVCHFEKAMPGFKGLSQLMTSWFAGNALAGYMFVNREQDLGIPGLRQAKQSYFPAHKVHKFHARFETVPGPDNYGGRECDRVDE